MKRLLLAGICSLVLTVIAGLIVIPILKKIKAGQTVYEYVKAHKEKNGTPTMGGLFFISTAVIVFFIFGGAKSRLSTVAVTIGVAFMLVGFIDDFLKVKLKNNDGLKGYQKVIFQLAIALVSGFFAYNNGLTLFNIPFIKGNVDLGIWTIPIVALIFIAITNSVNLTDGLDGLASNTSIVYFLALLSLICVQTSGQNKDYINQTEFNGLKLVCVVLIGSLLGFLLFNTNKAKVFMGDTGSLSLGGLVGAVSIFSFNSFFIPIIGIMFVLSSISVIVQVFYYKRTKKRVFKMAPIHHHFQLKGCTEAQISCVYSIITALVGAVCVTFAL